MKFKYHETSGDWNFYRAGYELEAATENELRFIKKENFVDAEDKQCLLVKIICFALKDKLIQLDCFDVHKDNPDVFEFRTFNLTLEEYKAIEYRLMELHWIDNGET